MGILILIAAVMFTNFFMFGSLADKDITGIWMFLGSQVFAIFAYVFIFIAWASISLFVSVGYWAITANWKFNDIVSSPKHLGIFLIKFIFGNWNRAELFKRSK
jgi:hypothetical protein